MEGKRVIEQTASSVEGKRVIEQTASSEVYTDDWFLKDSALNGTTKINLANLRAAILNGMDLSKIEDDIAPEFSTDTAYAKGDIVLHEDALFIFVANKATGDWDTNKVTGTSIGALIESIESRIDNLKLSDLGDDSTHRTVTDTEKSTWSAKQDALTFDDVPTDNSNNPVKSNGIYDALATKANSADLATVATSGSASDVSFDNTSSGLEADNVQDAIDEVLETAGKVDDIVSYGQSLVENKISDLSSLSAVGTASGDIATFTDGSDLPMPKLEVAIEPVQEGSGDPSPENIRPISGWDEVNVGVSGVNVFDIDSIVEIAVSSSANRNGLKFSKNGTYTVSAQSGGSVYYVYCRIFNANGTEKQTYNIVSQTTISNATFTISGGETFVVYDARGSQTIETSKDELNACQIQVEMGDTATAYEPYNGHTYTIDLGGTRYGGKIDLVSGVMVIDRISVNLNSLTWLDRYTGDINKTVSTTLSTNYLIPFDGICEYYKYVGWVSSAASLQNPDEREIGLRSYYQSSVTSHNTIYLVIGKNDNPQGKLVYPLVTPLTIQLTPTVVKSLRGVNNVFADTGAILDAEYIRDLTAIIDYILEQLNA